MCTYDVPLYVSHLLSAASTCRIVMFDTLVFTLLGPRTRKRLPDGTVVCAVTLGRQYIVRQIYTCTRNSIAIHPKLYSMPQDVELRL